MKLPVQLSYTNKNVFFSKSKNRKVKWVGPFWGLVPWEGKDMGKGIGK
jgi:hypothetical protein